MGQKPDYLRECMSDVPGVPIDDFNRNWCVVCTNSGCSRSSANGLAFTRRAENWKEDLFLNVKRASDDDPKYASIRSKTFGTPVPSYDITAPAPAPAPAPKWFAPVAVEEERGEEEEAPPDTEPSPETAGAQGPEPVAPMTPAVQPVPAVQPAPATGSPNTPFSQGTVLTGSPSQRTDVVMQPGQTYTFGDDE